MPLAPYRFTRLELAGSLGDLGTLIPLSAALIAITGLGFSPVIGLVGLFYIGCGLYFRLPLPVQPLKVVSALAIAFPDRVSPEIMAAAGLIFGAILLLLAATNLIGLIAKAFTRPIVRGIQLGLGLILLTKGLGFIIGGRLFLDSDAIISLAGLPVNPFLGGLGVIIVLILINSRRAPAALVVVGLGAAAGLIGAWATGRDLTLALGPSEIRLMWPAGADFSAAFFFLVLPQIPLTIGNAVIGTRETAHSLFGQGDLTARVSDRALSVSMGLANLAVGCLGGMPSCHGSGGLAAHYRFGARTGGSNIIIGLIFLALALAVGQTGLTLLTLIPMAILGVLLVFAGLELALLIRDVTDRNQLFIALAIAGVALATTNMAIAFISGMVLQAVLKLAQVDI